MEKAKTAIEWRRWGNKLAGSRCLWSLPYRLVILCFRPGLHGGLRINKGCHIVLKQKYGKALNSVCKVFPSKGHESLRRDKLRQ